jgi:hypothetical protein
VITLSHSGGYVIYYEARGAASGYIPDFNVNIAPASASAAAQSQRMLAEPPRDGGHRRFAGWARGLLLERVGDDGAGGCRSFVPTGRIDGAHADDGAGGVRADDARGPAPCRLAGCRCEGYRVRELAALARIRAREDAVHNHGVF